jgi:hypothetical protein
MRRTSADPTFPKRQTHYNDDSFLAVQDMQESHSSGRLLNESWMQTDPMLIEVAVWPMGV